MSSKFAIVAYKRQEQVSVRRVPDVMARSRVWRHPERRGTISHRTAHWSMTGLGYLLLWLIGNNLSSADTTPLWPAYPDSEARIWDRYQSIKAVRPIHIRRGRVLPVVTAAGL
jgi:hypothetical protein